VVDEAQDLTPMQFRMIARRAPAGSVTVLGDLAQATGPWTYSDWSEVRSILASAAPAHHDELTLGYRAPGRVLDFASRLLPAAAPGVVPTTSIRAGRTDPVLRRVEESSLAAASLAEAASLTTEHALVGLIAPEELAVQLAQLARRDERVGRLDRDAMTRPVTIVPAPSAKGLEFDAVVVAEPSLIAGSDQRGLRQLYVALTRPIQHLSIVHAAPLPAVLAG
jgi:DNA helicase IV